MFQRNLTSKNRNRFPYSWLNLEFRVSTKTQLWSTWISKFAKLRRFTSAPFVRALCHSSRADDHSLDKNICLGSYSCLSFRKKLESFPFGCLAYVPGQRTDPPSSDRSFFAIPVPRRGRIPKTYAIPVLTQLALYHCHLRNEKYKQKDYPLGLLSRVR